MVSSPSRSLLYRTSWYTTLGLATILLAPAPAAARYALQDDTPPLVAYSIDGIDGSNGWYRGSSTSSTFIVVHWAPPSDPESPILSTTGCEPAIRIDDPNTGTTRTCSATSAGGTTTVTTRLLKVDGTPPSTSAAAATAPNGAGWYRTPVSLQWSGTDATSGIASCSLQLTYSGPDTTGTSKSGSCTDNAGNASSAALTIHYDSTPPSISANTARAPDQGAWFNHPVDVNWSGTDGVSGIASCSSLTYSGPDDPNASVQGSCSDAAGNSNTASFALKYDSTRPVTTPAPSPAPNANGWLRTPVSIGWSGSDATSGIAGCDAATPFNGPDTAGSNVTGSCEDNAGNTSSGTFRIRYDATPPATAATPTRAPNGAGWFNAPVTITGSGTDALSEIDSCTSTSYGGPDTTGTSRSVTCTDKAGNSSSGSYVVRYDVTPPALTTPSVARTPDANGWYNHSVRVDWHGTDATSEIASCSSPTYAGPDGANAVVHGTCTDIAGNSTASDFSVQYDSTPPTVAVAAVRPADHDGWYNHPVSISWSGTDATSGIDSCTAPLTYSGPDSGNASSGGHCADRAGNSASPPALSFRYDATAPSTVALPSRPPDSGGWYNHRLTVDWGGSDPVSGISSCSSYTYSTPDAASVLPSGVCTDKAGNTSAPAAFFFRFDATPPTAIAAAPARPPDHDGWYNHPLPVQWSGSDAFSGVASCTSVDYGGPTVAAAVLPGSCTDQAGNTSDPLAFNLDYDATPPVLARLGLTALDGKVALRWRVSGASHVSVSRSPGIGQTATSVLYDGSAAAFVDRKAENYVRYRYVVTAEDAAGNTLRRTAAATPKPTLFAPRPGARVRAGSSPIFAWQPVRKARYYNLQLWLQGSQVGSWWPSRARLSLPSHWGFDHESHHLESGGYAWYVWPGRGPRRLGRYGPLLGKSTFAAR